MQRDENTAPASRNQARPGELEPDQDEAGGFLAALTGRRFPPITFQTFDDSPLKRKELARVLHGSLADHWHELVRLNRAGAGIFVMVNAGNGKGRSAADVEALRALFLDDDSGTLGPAALGLTPSIIVQSRHGVHVYWKLREGEPAEAFTPAQAALASALGTDPAVKDLPRVMRLPGFFHVKDPARPFMVRVVQTNDAAYTIGEVLEGNGADVEPEKPIALPRANGHAGGADASRRAQGWLLRRDHAEEGGRNDAAYRTACHLRDFGLSPVEALDLLRPWNHGNCPPLEEGELGDAVAHAFRYARGALGAKEDRARNGGASAGAPPFASPLPTPPLVETDTGIEVGGIKLVRAVAVPDERVEWLIPGFVARSELTDLSGDPGVGKGCITASWAARVTQEGDETALLFGTEDRLGHVMARLRAEGAELRRVYLLDIREANASPILPGDIDHVETLVRKTRASLVAFDPALEFMAAELDSHKQQDVQRFAAALAGVAHRTGVAALTVRHLNKAQGLAAVYKAAGSIAFIARARMALLAAKDKSNGGRVLTVVKGNIAKDTSSITFDILEKDESTVIAWGAATTVTADELVNQNPKRHGPAPEKRDAAKDFLADLLAAGPVAKQEVISRAKSAGLSRSLVYATAKEMSLGDATVQLKPAWRLP